MHAADEVIPWDSPQSNLRGQHLEVRFSRSPRRGPTCQPHFFTDWQHTPRSHTAGHAHWSSLTRLTFPGPRSWLTEPHGVHGWKGHTRPRWSWHFCPSWLPLTATSRTGKLYVCGKTASQSKRLSSANTGLNLAAIYYQHSHGATSGALKIFVGGLLWVY